MNVLVHIKLLDCCNLPKTDLLHEPVPFLCTYLDDEEVSISPSFKNYSKHTRLDFNVYFETLEDDGHLTGVFRIEVHDARLSDTRSEKLAATDETLIGYYEIDLSSLGEEDYQDAQQVVLSYTSDKRGRKLAKAGKQASLTFQMVGYINSFETYAEKFNDHPDVIIDAPNRRFFVPVADERASDLGLYAGLSFPSDPRGRVSSGRGEDEEGEEDERLRSGRRGRQKPASRHATADICDSLTGSCRGVQLMVVSTFEDHPFQDIDVCFELPARPDDGSCTRVLRALYFKRPKKLCKGLKAYFLASLLNLPLDVGFNKVRLYLTVRRAVFSRDLSEILEQCRFPGSHVPFSKAVKEFQSAAKMASRSASNLSTTYPIAIDSNTKAVYFSSTQTASLDSRSASGIEHPRGKSKHAAASAERAVAPQVLLQLDYSGLGDFRGNGLPMGAVAASSSGSSVKSSFTQIGDKFGSMSLGESGAAAQGFEAPFSSVGGIAADVFSSPLALRIAVVPEAEAAGYAVDYVSASDGGSLTTLASRLPFECHAVPIVACTGSSGILVRDSVSGSGADAHTAHHWISLLGAFDGTHQKGDISAGAMEGCGLAVYSLEDEPAFSWRFSSLLKPPKPPARRKSSRAGEEGDEDAEGSEGKSEASGGGRRGAQALAAFPRTALRGIGDGLGMVASRAQKVFSVASGKKIATGVTAFGGLMKRGIGAVAGGVKDIGSRVQHGVTSIVESDEDDGDFPREKIEDVEELDENPEPRDLKEKYRSLQERYRNQPSR